MGYMKLNTTEPQHEIKRFQKVGVAAGQINISP
jgi:hypothetical protein